MYKPITTQEKKAFYLETVLEKMLEARDKTYRLLKKSKKNSEKVSKETVKSLENKLESLNKGIKEVFEKADNAWRSL